MNRELKFRAFIDGVMIGADALAFEQYEPLADQLSKCPNLMQYTGLKDKNSSEIYEGDIVGFFKYKNFKETNIVQDKAVVKWGVTTMGVNGEYTIKIVGPYVEDEYMYQKLIDGELSVIGNIYETPELL